MGDAPNFLDDLPVADIRIGKKQYMRIYGYADIEPRLVEVRLFRHGFEDVIRLHVEQAEAMAEGFRKAAAKARAGAKKGVG